jgi:hypothetical protein
MSYSISYGNDILTSMTTSYDMTNQSFTVEGTSIVDSSFNLELNYSTIPSNTIASYTITVIRLE